MIVLIVYFVPTKCDLAIKNKKVIKKPPVSSSLFYWAILFINWSLSVSPFILKYYWVTNIKKPTIFPQFRVKEYTVTAEK